MPFEKKKIVNTVESVRAAVDGDTLIAPERDRRDTVRISDTVVWRAPNSSLSDKPLPAIVLSVGGRRTLSLYVFTDSGTRVVRGARHWTDPDFDNPNIDTTQLSSWSFNDE